MKCNMRSKDSFNREFQIVLEDGRIYSSGKWKGAISKQSQYSGMLSEGYAFLRMQEAMDPSWLLKENIISENFNEASLIIIKDNFKVFVLEESIYNEAEEERQLIGYFIAPAVNLEEAKSILQTLYEENPRYDFKN